MRDLLCLQLASYLDGDPLTWMMTYDNNNGDENKTRFFMWILWQTIHKEYQSKKGGKDQEMI